MYYATQYVIGALAITGVFFAVRKLMDKLYTLTNKEG